MCKKFFRGRFGSDTEAERVLKMVQKGDSGKVQNKGVVIARARAEKRWHLRCSLPLRVHSGIIRLNIYHHGCRFPMISCFVVYHNVMLSYDGLAIR